MCYLNDYSAIKMKHLDDYVKPEKLINYYTLILKHHAQKKGTF